MLKNYIKTGWRMMARNKVLSAINVLGLALGMACCLVIMLWIQHERSIDRYHQNGPFLYSVLERQIHNGNIEVGRGGPGLLAEELKRKFPEIVYAAASTTWDDMRMTFAIGNNVNKETGNFAGADWFRMFSVPLLAGAPATALSTPGSLAISRKLAVKYFGSPEAAMGKTIRIDTKKDYLVTAVFEDLPGISSKKYDFLLSWQDCLERNGWMKDWNNNGPLTYIQVRPDTDMEKLQTKMKHFLKEYNKALDANVFDIELFLQSYGDGYLYSNFKGGQQSGGRIEYIRLFTIVAIFLLLIACINFMNLATARSAKRAREIGVRKVMGAMRGSLAVQFIWEALLYAFLALIFALVTVLLVLPGFNALTGKDIQLPLNNGLFWLTVAGIAVITGLLAGSYPALHLSALAPVRVLKGSLKTGSDAKLFRQGLVIFQFILSMLLISGTLVVYQQMAYVQKKNLGYNRENLIYLRAEGAVATHRYDAFRETLLRTPGIQAVCGIANNFTDAAASTNSVNWTGKDPNSSVEFTQLSVSYDFTKTAGIDLLSGRDFSPAYGTDSGSYMINEAAARTMGLKNPENEKLSLWGKEGKIIGVVKDFHIKSLHTAIQPMIIWLGAASGHDNILVRFKAGETKQAIAGMEDAWNAFNPGIPITYSFVDAEYGKLYEGEIMVGKLSNYFAIIAIFISCLGLLALSSFMAEQRTKEIGVRKVLGASVQHVVMLLSKDFLKLVIIAIILSTPLAWYVMSQWLHNFAYAVHVEWWIFIVAGMLALTIALLTISYQSIKAALMNPVKSLRAE
ncbi:ABC transporter permease [Chitinophaga varians]|uniref:ABC transporter permease n=1 Tax=Chitinophaga varians TaxID=2202339 RepID=UPI00165FD3E3|nr:ABC transporter permease [Chitinophaga varians]MBC9915627.1 ABC transporter permease [Chitinophaga varians]